MGLLKKLQVADAAPEGSTFTETMMTNVDLIPLVPERRTWGWSSYVAFWVSDGVNLSTAVIVAASVADGLAWWETWIIVIFSYFLIAIAIVMSARPGAMFHIGFPVIARASFGIWGSLYVIFNRIACATLWFAFQSWLGGGCMTVLLRSIWPSYANFPNHLPASSGVTSQGMLSFFLFWLANLPGAVAKPEKVHLLFKIKAIITPLAFIALFGWSIAQAGGVGPIVHQPSTITGTAKSWLIVQSFVGNLGNFSGLVLNSSDFSRLARRPKDTVLPQLLAIPLTFIITSFVGLIIASSSRVIFPEAASIFNPLDLLSLRLDVDPKNSGARAGSFFISAAFVIGQIGTNVAANSLSAGTDLTALIPRYIDIRRGGLICALVAFALNPWRLASSTSNFATYLSAYSVLLSPFFGIIMADYYIVRRGSYNVADLYSASKQGTYRYWNGVNLRAVAAYLVGIAINLPGFAGALGADVPLGVKRVYNLAPFTGVLLAAGTYVLGQHLYPSAGAVPLSSRVWLEPKGGYEADNWEYPTAGGNDLVEDQTYHAEPKGTPSIEDGESKSIDEKPQVSNYHL